MKCELYAVTRGENQAICQAFQEIEERALRYILYCHSIERLTKEGRICYTIFIAELPASSLFPILWHYQTQQGITQGWVFVLVALFKRATVANFSLSKEQQERIALVTLLKRVTRVYHSL